MTRSRTKLEPWIENMIINHGTEKEMKAANMKARVIGVGKMSQSQALGEQGPPELLFLSDGAVQIPAILSDTAWEHLQEAEDRECVSSLVNTTVCLMTYSLQFHMSSEKRKCRFFLSLGKLATMAAGPVKDCPPCCTTLSSVRRKICDTWQALQLQNVSQTESCIDLSELLGVWHYECLTDLAKEVRERLIAARRSPSPQPSTSRDPPALPLGMRVRTEWDIARVRCKGREPFSIPMAHLVIPDVVAPPPGPTTQPDEGGGVTQSGLNPPSDDQVVVNSTPAIQPHAFTSRRTAEPQDEARGRGLEEAAAPPWESCLNTCEAMILEEMDPSADPWNRLTPLSKVFCTSSSSETSPGPRLSPSQVSSAQPDPVVHFQAECEERAVTSTQVSTGGLDHDVSPILVSSKGDQSFLPPYQNPAPLHASCLTPISSKSSPPDRMARAEPIAVQSSREKTGDLAKEADVYSDLQDTPGEAVLTTSSARVKRKRPEQRHPGTATGEPTVDLSPPSWLFESQFGPIPEASRSSQQAGVTCGASRLSPPAVHSDGSHFSYRYKVSLKKSQDLSRFKVADDRLHWAVKYLVSPKQANNNNNMKISQHNTNNTMYPAP